MAIWHAYAEKIQSGEIVACKKIKQAVARYFNDFKQPRLFL
ncbi:putative profilin/allergen [Haemophilus haemolyticus M19107]|nr:putative profilin/allergen [Haemophilus haemolyticus M19107]